MAFEKILFVLTYLVLVDSLVIKNIEIDVNEEIKSELTNTSNKETENPNNVFNGVYTDCLFGMSFICLQKKTLLYLKELNKLNEVSVFGDYLKFVRLNTSENPQEKEELMIGESSEELSNKINRAIDNFFDNHLIRFSALGKDLVVPRKVEEFVGRKKRKGGGGGGGHGGGDGGKKKMMMMAMMCMKMKLMMMVPAMMGMMGMMSFKGMMFSMMSFLISKMMLLMKILEKKGGGGGGGGGDVGWAAGGGGGGAWMPAGQDYGGGGGYDANGQWQSRSIIEDTKEVKYNKGAPIISYVKPIVRFNNVNDVKPIALLKSTNDEILQVNHEPSIKSRKKRGIMDVLQNAYMYWSNRVLGNGPKKHFNYPKYKIINGVKYVYNPIRNVLKLKTPKELKPVVSANEDPIVTIDNFNKGEIVEGVVEGRMNRRKFHKIKENVNETMDENPWQ